MSYPNGDGGASAVVAVECGHADALVFVDESPAGTFNFEFHSPGACKRVCTVHTRNGSTVESGVLSGLTFCNMLYYSTAS